MEKATTNAAAEQQAQAEETTVNTTAKPVKAATEETKGSGKGKKAAAARPCFGIAAGVAARTYHMFSPTRRR